MLLPRDDIAPEDGSSIPGERSGPMRVSFGGSQSVVARYRAKPEIPEIISAHKVWWVEGQGIASRFARLGFDRKLWGACAGPTTNESKNAAANTANTEIQRVDGTP